MPIVINYKNSSLKKNSSNLVLFVDEKFNILNLRKYLSRPEYSYIEDLIKTRDLKKKILIFDFSSKRKIILTSLKKNTSSSDLEKLGANFYDLFKETKLNEFVLNSDTIPNKLENLIG